jgi:DNA-binding protein HU-beta
MKIDKLNKKLLADMVAEKLQVTKKVALQVVDMLFDEMSDTLVNGGEVDITGFGRFEVKTRKSRVGINPVTKEKIDISSSKAPAFKASKTLKDLIK